MGFRSSISMFQNCPLLLSLEPGSSMLFINNFGFSIPDGLNTGSAVVMMIFSEAYLCIGMYACVILYVA